MEVKKKTTKKKTANKKKPKRSMKKYEDIDYESCLTCSVLLTKSSTELHHFPAPARAGGEYVIPLCIACHDMVDRIPLNDWPIDWAWKAVQGQNREGMLFIMKMMSKGWLESIKVEDGLVVLSAAKKNESFH